MKNMEIAGTGNSRFLRSALTAATTWEEARAMLIAGTFPIDLAGVNEAGIVQKGTPYDVDNVLKDTTAALFGLDPTGVLDSALKVLGTAAWRQIDLLDNLDGYSGTWTAPDVFGDGEPYDLGVYMIGAGGSGAVYGKGGAASSGYEGGAGGGSGFGKNIILEGVAPGTEFTFVIGKGGSAVTLTTSSSSYMYGINGNDGGSTAFAGETVAGGTGGLWFSGSNTNVQGKGGRGGQIACDPVDTLGNSRLSISALYGCINGMSESNFSQSPQEGQNQFNPTMVTLCAGGCSGQTIAAMPDGTKGGSGAKASGAGATAESATGYGNGGGGAFIYSAVSNTATSGKGSDGVIFLYARRKKVFV